MGPTALPSIRSAHTNRSRSKTGPLSDSGYKHAFVDFIKAQTWHWFITIPIGQCEDDDRVMSDLRKIEAILCGRYLTKRFHKLPDQARYSMLVVFEGEKKNGDRHAHPLVYVPKPIRRHISHDMAIGLFPQEFRFLWNQFRPDSRNPFKRPYRATDDHSDAKSSRAFDEIMAVTITPMTLARKVYVPKKVRLAHVPWSRFEFVRPPRSRHFDNKNLCEICNRDKQRRKHLHLKVT
jgi:hypothetical protein